MGTTIEVTYSKKLGLPNFSSHCLTVSVRADVEDISEVQGQTSLLYRMLQNSVDEELQRVGFIPDKVYGKGMADGVIVTPPPAAEHACTGPQRAMIIELARKYKLKKPAVDALAKELFGVAGPELNSHQAATFIKELRRRHESSKG